MTDQRTEKGVEHTAGPWTQCKDGDCPCGLIFCDGGGVFVAQAFNANNRDKHGLPDPVPTVESGKANARLIAAAPEMIEALESLIDAWVDHHVHHEPFSSDCEDAGGHGLVQGCPYCIGRSIVAKAKGTDHATG